MAELPTACPSCKKSLEVSRLKCRGCHTQLEGEFELPALLRLPAEDVELIEKFVLHSGSLKEMARVLDLSYPTVRNRLDEIIERLKAASKPAARDADSILDAIAKGTMSVSEGAKRLRRTR